MGSGEVTGDMLSHNREVSSHTVMINIEGKDGLAQLVLSL